VHDWAKRNLSIKPIGILDWRRIVGSAMIYAGPSASESHAVGNAHFDTFDDYVM
jgi:hypothetical protein